MRTLLILMLVCALYGAHQWWQKRDDACAAAFDAYTFAAVEKAGGVQRSTVLVLVTPNCSSERAQRTEALIRDLDSAGISVVRDSGFAFVVENQPTHRCEALSAALPHSNTAHRRCSSMDWRC